MKLRFLVVVPVALAVGPFASCDQQPQSNAASAQSSVAPAAQGASITASPNPVPASKGMGTTKVTWNTGGKDPGAVYIFIQEGTESLFAQGIEGNKEATWIQPGSTYEFRLYNDVDRKTLLATVKVTGSK